MDRYDGLRPPGHPLRRVIRIDHHRFRIDLAEHDLRPGAHEGGRRAREGVGGDDDFVPGANARQQRRHLECPRAAVGEQNTVYAVAFLQRGRHTFREWAVASENPVLNDLLEVFSLFAGKVRNIESGRHGVSCESQEASRAGERGVTGGGPEGVLLS